MILILLKFVILGYQNDELEIQTILRATLPADLHPSR